jgi:hypothetical protein
MKRAIFCILFLSVFGCTYEGKPLSEYFEDPRSIIRDPHFADYKKKRDNLESQYLSDEITYADYKEQMDTIDKKYAKEIKLRDAKVRDQ